MNWTVSRHDLPLSTPFGISRGTSEVCECVVVELTHEGTTGYGAVTPSAYFGETAETVAETLPDLLAAVDDVGDPHAGQRIERLCHEVAPDQPAARSAVGIAVADWAARALGVPLYRQWGLDPARVPATSYTVGIAPPEEMASKAHRAVNAGFDIVKLKLGTDDDRARFDAVRKAVPDAELRVDANAAWDADEAVEKAAWLESGGVTMLEQPVAADDVAGLARVTDVTTMAVCADEACQTATDVPRLADACNVVNVKLAKCGGPRAARRLVHTADAHRLATMLGCMVESSASLAAAVHLAPLVDYADLDGALLLDSDPFDGVPIEGDRFDLHAVDAGTGARRR
ncbi:dipeptide epimerase [Haloarcula salinisoli]|uniref:Dipeptide epimerase n=1 Tax=Haloarcula salinisoli TaxID=2487746 RepID=A0A8J7YG30_9EURY|nr:dipeptide epimerase [Halomicroarcula salinisoli]MBX0287597.1 dipeptide epimerase [Halomicroarcula salinisoli]MBX0304837.1 dipeptide epimerase [Halomicroarcula salinisoli]